MFNKILKKVLVVTIVLFITFFAGGINVNACTKRVAANILNTTTTKLNEKITIGTRKQTTVSAFTKQDGTNDLCDNENGVGAFVGKYWKIIVFSLPFLLIVLTTFDFFKAIVSSDADALKKSSNTALKRALIAIILLCLPFIINTIFGEWFKICL